MKALNIRFFCFATNDEIYETDMYEITEKQFLSLQELPTASVSYQRSTLRENGYDGIDLTITLESFPYYLDLDLVDKSILDPNLFRR